MTTKRSGRTLVMLFVTLLLSSCADLFTANYFSNFDGPPSSSDLLAQFEGNPAGLLNALNDAASSDRFYDELSTADRAALRAELTTILNSADATDSQKASAALLSADVTLKGTQAEATVNNLTAALLNAGDGGLTDPGSLITSVLPQGASAAEVAAILESLATAADAYTSLGTSLANGGDTPTDANMTAVTQSALVSLAVKNLVDQSSTGALAEAATADDPTTAIGGLGLSDPISAQLSDENSSLRQIASTAGTVEDLLASFQ